MGPAVAADKIIAMANPSLVQQRLDSGLCDTLRLSVVSVSSVDGDTGVISTPQRSTSKDQLLSPGMKSPTRIARLCDG